MVVGQINESLTDQYDSTCPFPCCDVSVRPPSGFKMAQRCAPFELFPRDSPVLYLSTPFPCLHQDLPRNYKHRCALFHFAPLPLCPPLLYSSYSKWRGLKDPVLLPWLYMQGESRTGPCVRFGRSGVVTQPSLSNLKTYLRLLSFQEPNCSKKAACHGN